MSPSPDQGKTLAANIREFRRSINLSQRDFAKLFNVTQANVSQWESASVSPPMALLQIIKKKYKYVSVECFFTEAFPDKTFENPDHIAIERLRKEIEVQNSRIESLQKEKDEKQEEIVRLRDQIDVLNKVLKRNL